MKGMCLVPLTLLFVLFMFAGCATKGPVGSGIPHGEKMQTHPADDRALLYVNQQVPKKTYTRFIVEPVTIYEGEDNGFGDIPAVDRRMMADFTRNEVIRVIGEKYMVVNRPGPDTMRIKLILVGVEKTKTVMRGLTYGNPMGLIMNLGKGAAGREGAFMGWVTLAGEFEDTETGMLLAAFMGKIHPFAMDLSFSPWDAAKEGVSKFAKDLRDAIDRKQATSQ
ncbi:MAG TPA: hypothetical protein DCR97_08165 [Deltaproteobacteria bacterium]|nr:hypothetical protein [Deltaproteobacteria bacterium]